MLVDVHDQASLSVALAMHKEVHRYSREPEPAATFSEGATTMEGL